jgi:hypothetical protein
VGGCVRIDVAKFAPEDVTTRLPLDLFAWVARAEVRVAALAVALIEAFAAWAVVRLEAVPAFLAALVSCAGWCRRRPGLPVLVAWLTVGTGVSLGGVGGSTLGAGVGGAGHSEELEEIPPSELVHEGLGHLVEFEVFPRIWCRKFFLSGGRRRRYHLPHSEVFFVQM